LKEVPDPTLLSQITPMRRSSSVFLLDDPIEEHGSDEEEEDEENETKGQHYRRRLKKTTSDSGEFKLFCTIRSSHPLGAICSKVWVRKEGVLGRFLPLDGKYRRLWGSLNESFVAFYQRRDGKEEVFRVPVFTISKVSTYVKPVEKALVKAKLSNSSSPISSPSSLSNAGFGIDKMFVLFYAVLMIGGQWGMMWFLSNWNSSTPRNTSSSTSKTGLSEAGGRRS